jgi:hypothetical protein
VNTSSVKVLENFLVRDVLTVIEFFKRIGNESEDNVIRYLDDFQKEFSKIKSAHFVLQYSCPEVSGLVNGILVATAVVDEEDNTEENFEALERFHALAQKCPEEIYLRISSMEY